ncbi:hypothetical protein BCR35DRAFT_195618 [Leucosporidium creatinivorum]|uniref:tRNA(Ile)-lysidine synthetase n=1 Tax=Leucosporidium creatinivorum TaxID=106004 RepID=A0A1Y2DS26_9BASI|nr:hypothetical protein BCR35DRAFT_195618 [Leucosporidium creatinivorum]
MHPITPADFYRAVQRITPRSGWPSARIAVAVSGGPDSIALLHLLAQYVREPSSALQGALPRPRRLVAVTVDHRLRAESAAEAEAVKRFSHSFGLEHHTLPIPWGQPPFPSFPAPHKTEAPAHAARLLLYRQLFRQEGVASLWTGHHRGDQVENLLMRGRGMESVARMDGGGLEEVEEEERWIVRPLLGFDKAQLVGHCIKHSLPYFVDPTNLDPHHTPRNALRQTLAESQARHLSHPHTLPSASISHSGPLQLLHHIIPTPSPPQQPSSPPIDLLTINSLFPRPSPFALNNSLLTLDLPKPAPFFAVSYPSPLPYPKEVASPKERSNAQEDESGSHRRRGSRRSRLVRVWSLFLNGKRGRLLESSAGYGW